MSNRYTECLKIVLSNEGRLSNHPADKGGLTNFGVTQERFTAYLDANNRPDRSVVSIDPFEVEEIYLEYWDSAKCAEIPEPLDLQVFDVSINSGANKAIVLLQRALNMQPDHHTGNYGPITRARVRDAVITGSVGELCKAYLAERRKFYRNRVRLEPSQQAFIDGWMARVDHMGKFT